MSENSKNKDKCAVPYMPEEMMPEREPDYKDLYFSLLSDVFKLKNCIYRITGRLIHKTNKNMRVFELSEEDMDIFSKNNKR